VRNIRHDPHVRVRLRIGLRYLWMPGIATVLPDDDPLARQRRIIAWHPLRALNAINVRALGADLLTVHWPPNSISCPGLWRPNVLRVAPQRVKRHPAIRHVVLAEEVAAAVFAQPARTAVAEIGVEHDSPA
jgi:hypothetical protein